MVKTKTNRRSLHMPSLAASDVSAQFDDPMFGDTMLATNCAMLRSGSDCLTGYESGCSGMFASDADTQNSCRMWMARLPAQAGDTAKQIICDANPDMKECMCVSRNSNDIFKSVNQNSIYGLVPFQCWYEPCMGDDLQDYLVPASISDNMSVCPAVECTGDPSGVCRVPDDVVTAASMGITPGSMKGTGPMTMSVGGPTTGMGGGAPPPMMSAMNGGDMPANDGGSMGPSTMNATVTTAMRKNRNPTVGPPTMGMNSDGSMKKPSGNGGKSMMRTNGFILMAGVVVLLIIGLLVMRNT